MIFKLQLPFSVTLSTQIELKKQVRVINPHIHVMATVLYRISHRRPVDHMEAVINSTLQNQVIISGVLAGSRFRESR